ncbi:OsmC family protein [Flavobacterium sp.]|uniref:OsmC family protein n=1 Tax=Flavobacterium sp. TaxID=239 RepID=UPI002487ADD0|nr:OsmC family protein [Flavobacterium sp.]MDI1316354.1 OsmC family protein [Flavobacterium sp.]
MTTSIVRYLGDLRSSSMHLQSGTEILNDAPIDNHGKGEAFSPTDMVANSLATCMLTIMAIKAIDLELELKGTTAEVTKIMVADPRRISEIHITFQMNLVEDKKISTILERSALTCPVYYSLHPDVKKVITFNWK